VVADLLPRARRSSFLQLEASAFVGRHLELVELSDLLSRSRLVTLVGEPGVGKTRLAQRFAAMQRSAYASAWFCDLRDARDAEGMCAALARTLSIADEANVVGASAVKAVGRAVAARGRTLLVLDNVEQLLPGGASVVVSWLDLAPEAHVLVTSRVPLDVLGEELFELDPLPLAGEDDEGAVALFVERVRAMKQGFAPSGEQARAIADVVRSVRGVPLAVELCASRYSTGDVRLFAPRGLLCLDAAMDPIAWSFRKLDLLEREALAQCSVFRGGFTFEAAERVVELPTHEWPMPKRIHGVLAVLLQKSLIQPLRAEAGGARFTLCEGIRAFAAGYLDQSVEASGAPWRHAQLYLDLASGPLLDLPATPSSATTREELAAERENLEAALEFGAVQRRPDIVLRAAVALDFVSSGTGISSARLARLDEALESAHGLDASMVGRALGVRAAALGAVGRLEEAERDARTALTLAQRGGSTRQVVSMHLAVGAARFQMGDLEQALAYTRAGSQVARAGGHRPEESLALQQSGGVLQAMGEAAEAGAHYEAALQLALETGDEIAEARAAMGLGSYHLEAGDLERAEVCYDRALLIARRRGMARSVRIVMGYLGVLHFDAGRLQEAERWLDSAVRSSRAVGDLRIEGIFEGMRAAVLASLDLVDEARAAFLSAHQLLAPHPYFRSVIDVHQGHLELAEAREAGRGPEEEALIQAASQRIARAEAWDEETPPLVRRSDDARIAVRILRRALAG
jgi:predicted ATPase